MPFWEAIDRLTAAAGLIQSVTSPGPFGVPPAHVQFQSTFGAIPSASMADEGPVAYVGPFRVGPVVVHENFDRVFLKPAGPSPGLAPESPGAFYAEVPLMAEPSLIAVQVGPVRRVEAVDDAGRSLLDPKLGGEIPYSLSPSDLHGSPRLVRVPLARAGGPSKSLATLRAALPREVGRRPAAPTLVVPLEGSSGKTFRDGDLAITVREYRVDASGTAAVRLAARIEGARGVAGAGPRSVADARLWSVFHRLIELVDSQGKPVGGFGGGSSISGDGPARELTMSYNFSPAQPGARPYPPTRLRIYRPEWVAWDLPLEFKDVPLP